MYPPVLGLPPRGGPDTESMCSVRVSLAFLEFLREKGFCSKRCPLSPPARFRRAGEVARRSGPHASNCGGYISPRSAKLTADAPPMTRWSRTRTSMRSSASRSLRVSASSQRLGSGTPLGWLWARMTAAALSSSARRATSRGWTAALPRVPWNRSSQAQ